MGLNFSLHTCKMRVKKSIFSACIFSQVKIWGQISVVLILDMNLFSSFLKWRSLKVYPSENPVNGDGLHWIQRKCADDSHEIPCIIC